MGYFYLILQAFIFSFGGLMIKAAGGMFSPFLISGLRFAIGVAILLIILKVRSGHFRLPMASRILLAGGVCKALHYLPENFGIMRGFSYGGILVWPVQTVVILVFSALFRRERFSARMLAGMALCVSGIGVVSWNGASPQIFLTTQAVTLLAFVLAGIGAAGFSISQKKLVDKMDIVELNTSMFLYGLITVCIVLIPTGPHLSGRFTWAGLISMIALGAITCFGFLLQAAAVKTVPLLSATIIQSSSVILNIVWGVLLYGDPLTTYVIAGSAMFLTGIVLVNLPAKAGGTK